jgi:hypothetical protein
MESPSLDSVRKDVEKLKSNETVTAANKFVSGLDAVTDALLLVILKFGRATTALWSVGIVVVLCLLVLLAIMIDLTSLGNRMGYIELRLQDVPALCGSVSPRLH